MISYRQADLRDKIREPKDADIFDVRFRYDESEEGDSRFHYYSIDNIKSSSREEEDRKWHYIHEMIPRLVEEERVYLHPMDTQNSYLLVQYIVKRLKENQFIKSAEKLNQEVLQEPVDINGRDTGQKRLIQFVVRIIL